MSPKLRDQEARTSFARRCGRWQTRDKAIRKAHPEVTGVLRTMARHKVPEALEGRLMGVCGDTLGYFQMNFKGQ